MKIKIGIDIGGTFTHATAINSENLKIIDETIYPTTHTSPDGIGEGVKICLDNLLSHSKISPHDILLIAFSTTQTTNALLEGDVCPVGIISAGQGILGSKAKQETELGKIELYENKNLNTFHEFLHTDNNLNENKIKKTINKLISKGVEVIVAATAFSTEDPTIENLITSVANSMHIPATSSHEISQLYGLGARTRTAVLNASMIPTIIKSAESVEKAIFETTYRQNLPIMVMRSDGGVMSIGEMKKRPILSLLSGPAAGIAGALFYSMIFKGIFLEVGGTSTDISYIDNGKVELKDAIIGGKRLYLKTVNTYTIGNAGGSLPRITKFKNTILVGPRSAHIAGMQYVSYLNEEDLIDSSVVISSPLPNDPDNYVFLKLKNGKFAGLTNTCMAVYNGYLKEKDYGFGNLKSIETAILSISSKLKISKEEFLKRWFATSTLPIEEIIKKILRIKKLKREDITLIGGGGGAKAIVPKVAEKLKMKYLIVDNYPSISSIGVGLAMLREVISKSEIEINRDEILKIRRMAFSSLINMGASENSINIEVEIDKTKNTITAYATGSVELKMKDEALINIDQAKVTVSKNLNIKIDNISLVMRNPFFLFFEVIEEKKKIFSLVKVKSNIIYVLSNKGLTQCVIKNGKITKDLRKNALNKLEEIVKENIVYDDSGKKIPELIIFSEQKKIDLTKLISLEQMKVLLEVELTDVPDDSEVIFIFKKA